MWEKEWHIAKGKGNYGTLVGRKVPMTSEVFWVSCGPPGGGGGGTTRGPAIMDSSGLSITTVACT